MKTVSKYILCFVIITGVSACNQKSSETVGQKIDRATDKAGNEVSDASKKTGEVIDDSTITAKIKASILEEPNLKSLQINVDTTQGVVTLSGTVDSQAQLDTVRKIANATPGVKDVKSQIVVKSGN